MKAPPSRAFKAPRYGNYEYTQITLLHGGPCSFREVDKIGTTTSLRRLDPEPAVHPTQDHGFAVAGVLRQNRQMEFNKLPSTA